MKSVGDAMNREPFNVNISGEAEWKQLYYVAWFSAGFTKQQQQQKQSHFTGENHFRQKT